MHRLLIDLCVLVREGKLEEVMDFSPNLYRFKAKFVVMDRMEPRVIPTKRLHPFKMGESKLLPMLWIVRYIDATIVPRL